MFLDKFVIRANNFLSKSIVGFCNSELYDAKYLKNPNFLQILKNDYNNEPHTKLLSSRNDVMEVLMNDLPLIPLTFLENNKKWLCVNVPRAKCINNYRPEQLMFLDALKKTLEKLIPFNDGTDFLIRQINTKTTHYLEPMVNFKNDGPEPYPGITKDTCYIDTINLKGEYVLLIDDIYHPNINVVEDCIQALFDAGVTDIVFCAITRSF
jgi:hypothetical protein